MNKTVETSKFQEKINFFKKFQNMESGLNNDSQEELKSPKQRFRANYLSLDKIVQKTEVEKDTLSPEVQMIKRQTDNGLLPDKLSFYKSGKDKHKIDIR